ncbi:MAG: flagellin lysine-N-methylase [Oscillospiraceae bacterium]|nr:flagellin lysine-N-methylase [Oscillospiraceae bacterium]
MKEIKPSYYDEFHCTAGACRHTCCRDWEIDVDEATLSYYQTLPGQLGERLRQQIVTAEDGTAQFRLREDESCPFLNERNLCDLIPALGEEHLCQICTDHPRFRNFFSDRTEIGLGLCCEEAARLILTRREATCFIEDGEETLLTEETEILRLRTKLIGLMQDRALPIQARFDAILTETQARLPELTNAEWADFLFSLERLDPAWEQRLACLRNGASAPIQPDPVAEEQLGVYFLYRHLAGAVYDGDLAGRTAFAVLSCRLICAIWSAEGSGAMDEWIEIAREYSSEIEYSEDNLCSMLDRIDLAET